MLNEYAVQWHTLDMDQRLPDTADPDEESALLARLLDGHERARAARFLRPGDGLRWSRVHARLRQILGERCGVPPASLRFGSGPHGKPFLAAPAGGASCRFNLSHAHRRALIAVADGAELGVDIERSGRRADLSALAGSVLDEAERERFDALPAEQRQTGFTRAWVRKEAVLKALGTGIGFGLQRVHVGLDPVPALRIDARCARDWRLLDLAAPRGYRAAACIGVSGTSDTSATPIRRRDTRAPDAAC